MKDVSRIKGVELPEVRSELIVTVLDLMDGLYQERAWIETKEPKANNSFRNEIEFCIEMFDDQRYISAVVEERIPYDDIGWSLKTKKEAEIALGVSKPLRHVSHNCYYNDEHLATKELYDMREKSLEAFGVFMENEKDNEEFCKFIMEVILKQKRINADEIASKTAYESILFYMGKCLKQNKQIRQERGF